MLEMFLICELAQGLDKLFTYSQLFT